MKDQTHISHLVRRLKWQDLDEKYLLDLIKIARAEDVEALGLKNVPSVLEDVTTMSLTPDIKTTVYLNARKDCTVCGLNLVQMILDVYAQGSDSPVFTPNCNDGDVVKAKTQLGSIKGDARVILQAERILLNFLQRLSGVASATSEYVLALGNSKTMLLDTRKTTPSLRVLEKYAFACGGGYTHRIGLFDRVMLKDNHLFVADATLGESLAKAVLRARQKNPNLAIEVEVDSLEQIEPVLNAKADVIMLDNFSLENTKTALKIIGDKAWTELSGGVKLDTLKLLGQLGADFISTAASVHSSSWIDIGLDS